MNRVCSAQGCETSLHRTNKHGLCNPCRRAAQAKTAERGTCTCGARLGRGNSSGRCRNCFTARLNADPATAAKISAGQKRGFQLNPERLAALRQRAIRIGKLPHAIEGRRRHCIEKRLWERGNAAQPAGSPARILAGARRTDQVLAWCPRELRQMYRDLLYSGTKAADAKVLVLEHHETQMRRFRAKLTQHIAAAEPVLRLPLPATAKPDAYDTEAMLRTVAVAMGLDASVATDNGQSAEAVTVRTVVAVVMARQGRRPTEISRALQRDRSSVRSMLNGFEKRCRANPVLAQVVDGLAPAREAA